MPGSASSGSIVAALTSMALPDLLMHLVLTNSDATSREALLQHVDKVVSTTNPAVLPDGSNVDEATPPKINPHICLLKRLRTLTRTWLTLSPLVSVTPNAQLPTVCVLTTAIRSVGSAIPSLSSLRRSLLWRMKSQFC